jgi:TolB-like protein
MVMARISLLSFVMAVQTVLAAPIWAGTNYEESLKQLAESVITEAVKAKKRRLAFLDFTDAKGRTTLIGQFLSDEIGTQVLLAGELNVVERTLVHSTLKKLRVTQIEPANAKAVRRAAKAIRADAFVVGSFLDSPDGLLVTAKLISPLNAQVVGAARGTLPQAGPLGELIRDADKPAVVAKVETPTEPAAPAGLGFHRNELYELVVLAMEKQDHHIKMDLTIENKSPRDLKILCLLQDTTLKDERGATWSQGVEENRDGLCTRGLELSPREKDRAVLTFTSPDDASGTRFTLHYHEKSPRRDAAFTIDGLALASNVAPATP